MEGKDVDLLFGLDMLMRHQAVIDLKQRILIVNDERILFLAEHELPRKAQEIKSQNIQPSPNAQPITNSSSHGKQSPTTSSTRTTTSSSLPQQTRRTTYPELSIKTVMDLGFSREEALQSLEACEGNVDNAANMLFQM